ncbi:MAG: serine hydrolase [Kiritimatiellae bacterium]|nr:serine hydrolase [Kiritimatiellia bacterium]
MTVRKSAAKALDLILSASLAFVVFSAFAQDEENAGDTENTETDPSANRNYGTPDLPEITREERVRATRELKRVENRSKRFGIFLNRGKMEKLKGDRLMKVLKEYDRFIAVLEELPEGFVKACNIGSVWFSDEIVDASGQHAGGFAAGEGINLSFGFSAGTVYHEMFHKFECCITDSQRREWEELNPKEFIYEGSAWDTFAGNDKYSKKAAARHLMRVKAGKEKSAMEKRDEARSMKDAKRIAANKTNETVQAAFLGSYAQTTPLEDRACMFGCMMEEGPRFFLRTQRSEHLRRKMEFMMKLTGTRKFLGTDFWEEHSDASSGGGVFSGSGSAESLPPGATDMPSVDPEAMGYDARRLAALSRAIVKHDIPTESMVVVVGGKVIFTYGDVSRPAELSSCWTSLLSILYGRFVQMKRIDLDETLESIGITDNVKLERRERSAKVRDLIASRSGCYITASNDPPGRKLPDRTSKLPGNNFFYSNWDFNVAARILEVKTEADIFAVFDEMVARPLRLQDWDMSRQRRVGDILVSEHLACEFSLSARDLARIGQMMLNKGKWRGLQVVPASWVAQSTSAVSKFPGGGGFGYMWWIEDEEQKPKVFNGAFSARGVDGQRLTVIPKLDMVVAHLPRRGGAKKMRNADYKKLLTAVFLAKKDPVSARTAASSRRLAFRLSCGWRECQL